MKFKRKIKGHPTIYKIYMCRLFSLPKIHNLYQKWLGRFINYDGLLPKILYTGTGLPRTDLHTIRTYPIRFEYMRVYMLQS